MRTTPTYEMVALFSEGGRSDFQQMGLLKHKIEGGSGGRRGHSNMNHAVETQEIKTVTKKHRHSKMKRIVREVLENGDARI